MSHCTSWVRNSMPRKVFAWGYSVVDVEGTAQQLIQPERELA
jgi:predicted FMN-binding regulatory protein PaiB